MLSRNKLFVALLASWVPLSSYAVDVWCHNCANTWQAEAILLAIGNSATKISKSIQGASTAQTAVANKNAQTIANANANVTVGVEQAKVAAQYTMLDPCTVTAAAQSTHGVIRSYSSGRGGGAGGSGGSNQPVRSMGASREMLEVIRISEGEAVAPAPEVVSAKAALGACNSYASGGERRRMCAGANFATTVASGFPNADVSAETIFDGPQSQADKNAGLRRRLTITKADSAERTAVAAFIRNLETPLDLRGLRPKELDSTSGRNYIALRDAYDAVISMATKPLRDQERNMVADTGYINALKQLLAGDDAAFVTSYLQTNYPNWAAEGVSLNQFMDLEAQRRYKNEAWYYRMVGADARILQLEQVQMQAYQIWQQNLILERMQQQSIISGAVAGATLRQEKLPQLIAVHKSAQSQ